MCQNISNVLGDFFQWAKTGAHLRTRQLPPTSDAGSASKQERGNDPRKENFVQPFFGHKEKTHNKPYYHAYIA